VRRVSVIVLALLVTGCTTTATLRGLERPEAALGDAHTVGLEVVPDSRVDKLPDGTLVSTIARSRFATSLEERAHFALCSPAPCGDGTLQIALRDVHLNAPLTERSENVVEFGADVAFLPREGPPRTVRLRYSSIETKAVAPEVRLRGLIDDAARWYAERFASSSSFRELHLDAGPGLKDGVDLLLAADVAGAEKAFRAETVRAPDRAAAWYDLGVSLELLGKWKSALEAYERAVQLDAKAADAEKAVAALKRMLAN
jgi:tetratricopeptide (TPR) repeat protein